jgi:tripartite-type tricarboxylate transporter receptor subunit TctC
MLLLALVTGAAHAQAASPDAFPSRPITLIVPFPPGGPSDALARVLAQSMSGFLKQPIVVENIAGAGGTIGLGKLASAPNDGYVIGFGTVGTHVANVALYKTLPYDPIASFAPIGLAGTAPTMLVAKPSLPVSNLKEFVAYADVNRAAMTFGSAGVGSISHIACVILLTALHENITHVPYRGVGPAMNDLMGGHIDFMCDQTTTALPIVLSGKIKAVATLTDRPLSQLPGVATAISAGYSDINVRAWNAFFAPKATPPQIVKRLNEALRFATADPVIVTQMQSVGVDLPAHDALDPNWVTELIVRGIEHDVPALRASGERLD